MGERFERLNALDGTLNGLHGTIRTENGTLNSLHGMTGTLKRNGEQFARNGLYTSVSVTCAVICIFNVYVLSEFYFD
jgi:hypothetical protein